MLDLVFNRRDHDCDGTSRRDFLKVGALGLGALTLPQLLASRARASALGKPVKDTSVVWLWLGGGPTHVETFDPKMSAPVEYRSLTGEVKTSLPGVTLGGTFPMMAKVARQMAFVRSFAHTNSGHGGGTHWVMTGHDNLTVDNGGLPTRPSMGSVLARVRGPNHGETGMPTYVRLGGIGADGAAFLGAANAPVDPAGQARQNMTLSISRDRLQDRRYLLKGLDRMKQEANRDGFIAGMRAFEEQAFSLVLHHAPVAFDLKKEQPALIASYGRGLGEQLLIARRLCEAGCGFVTIQYGGWDMHGQLKRGIETRALQLDRAVATFVEDVRQRGLQDKVLLVITGEFGRTPRINRGAGRDHWAPLSTLALAGGGLNMGQVIGESTAKAEKPLSAPITPADLMATVFHVLGIDPHTQFVNNAGRPVYMLEKGRPIAGLV